MVMVIMDETIESLSCAEEPARPQHVSWKEPINGKTAFFTEEVYCQLVGPEPSLEERAMQLMDVLGYDPPPTLLVSASSATSCKRKHEESDGLAISKRVAWAAVSHHPPVFSTTLSLDQQQPSHSPKREEPAQSVSKSSQDESLFNLCSEPVSAADGPFHVSIEDKPAACLQGRSVSTAEDSAEQSSKEPSFHAQGRPVPAAEVKASSDELVKPNIPLIQIKGVKATCVSQGLQADKQNSSEASKTGQSVMTNCPQVEGLRATGEKKDNPICDSISSPASPEPEVGVTDIELQSHVPFSQANATPSVTSPNKSSVFSASFPSGCNTDQDMLSDHSGSHQETQRSAKPKKYQSKRPPPPVARKSSLKHGQHIRYLDLFKKYMKRFLSGFSQPPTDKELQDLKEFEKLQVMVAKEQEECQVYLKQLALHNFYLYTRLPPHVMKYTQEKEQGNWRRAESYSRYYNNRSHLPLTITSPLTSLLPTLLLVKTLVHVGSKCRLHTPEMNPNPNAKAKRTVPTDIQKVTSRFPPVHANRHHSIPDSAWNHESPSKDRNMESLVRKYHCHIATTASVLQQLVGNHAPDFSTSWDIPVVVKEFGDRAASKKVVFLDKPLLPAGLSQSQRQVQYLQKAVLAYLCQPHNDKVRARCHKGQAQGHQNQVSSGKLAKMSVEDGRRLKRVPSATSSSVDGSVDVDDDPFGASVSMDDLETFGSSSRVCTRTGRKESATSWKPETKLSAGVKSVQIKDEAEKSAKRSAMPKDDLGRKGFQEASGVECQDDEKKGDSGLKPAGEVTMVAEGQSAVKPGTDAVSLLPSSAPQPPSPSSSQASTAQPAQTTTSQPPATTVVAVSGSQPTITSSVVSQMPASNTPQLYVTRLSSIPAVFEHDDTGTDSEEDGLVIALPESMETSEKKTSQKPSYNEEGRDSASMICNAMESQQPQLHPSPAGMAVPAENCNGTIEGYSRGGEGTSRRMTRSSAQKFLASDSVQGSSVTPAMALIPTTVLTPSTIPSPASPTSGAMSFLTHAPIPAPTPVLIPSTMSSPASPTPGPTSSLTHTPVPAPTPVLIPSTMSSPASPTPGPISSLTHTPVPAPTPVLIPSTISSPASPTLSPKSSLTHASTVTPAPVLRSDVKCVAEQPIVSLGGGKDRIPGRDAGGMAQKKDEHAGSAAEGQARRHGKPGTKKQPFSTPLDSILKEMTPSGDSTSVQFQEEDPSRYTQPGGVGEHVGYHLWNLSGVSLVVRCSNHAFTRDQRQQQKCVYIRAKAERQTHYGLEQVTLSESVHAWLGCYLRPNSYLLRARVNMEDHEVVHMDELTLDKILPANFNFSPACAFAVLQNIFTKLMELPAGSYLLSHQAGTDHIQLKAGTESKRGGHDLRCHYMGLGVMNKIDKTVPWVPVDPTLMLPHHWRLGLIPATFQPPDFDHKKKKQKRQFTGSNKNQKNQNKKGRQK